MKKVFTSSGLIIYKEKILLVWNNDLNIWLQPGGRILDFENAEESLTREVKKATNYDIRIIGVNPIQLSDSSNSKILNTPLLIQEHNFKSMNNEICLIDMVYLATLNENHFISSESIEDLNYHWFTKDEIKGLYVNDNTKEIIMKAYLILDKSKEKFSQIV